MQQQRSEIWDLFYPPGDPSGLWFAFQLARSLGEHRQHVRLFCDDVAGLSVVQAHLIPDLLIQVVGHVEIIDFRLAANVAPGHNLLEVFGEAPAPYVSRFLAQRGRGSWYSLRPPWSDRIGHSAIQLRDTAEDERHFDVQLGDNARSAGLIRSGSSTLSLRQGPQALQAARSSLMSLLGLSEDLLQGGRTAALSASTKLPWEPLLHALIDGDEPHCLFIEQGALAGAMAPFFSRPAGLPGASTLGGLTAIFLPPLLWALVDEIISVSDTVLTDRVDVLFRAVERGTPAICAQAEGQGAGLGPWLYAEAQAGLSHCHAAAAQALATGAGLPEALGLYLSSLEDYQRHAWRLQERISRASDLVSLLLTSSDVPAAASVELLFAPTRPNPLI